MCETERNDFGDIKLHDENNEVSTKSEMVWEILIVFTRLVCEYINVVFKSFKNTLVGPWCHLHQPHLAALLVLICFGFCCPLKNMFVGPG